MPVVTPLRVSAVQINMRLPTHVKAPNKNDMLKLLKKVDRDEDGELDFEEFLEAARRAFYIGLESGLY